MYRILKDRNAALNEALIGFAQQLISTPSPSLGEAAVAGLVERKMRELGYEKVFRDEAGNVVGLLLGREAGPTVLLNCHMDTVSPEADGKWSRSPHTAQVDGGRLYGLGAADCKGGVAAHVYTGALLKRSLLPLRGNLIVAATVAEENGRSVGVRALLEKTLPGLDLKPDHAILGEPTALGLYYGHDGWVELDICVESANPFDVDDAATAIVNDFGAGRMSDQGDVESFVLDQPRFHNVDGLRKATIGVTRRLRPAESIGDVLQQLQHNAALAAQPSGAVAVEVLIRQENQRLYTGTTTLVRHVTNAWAIDPFDRLMERSRQALSAADCEVRPGKWQLGRLGMGTAGSLLVSEFAVPTIGYGPGDETMAHARDEYVQVDKLLETPYGTAAIVHSLIGVPVCGWTSDEI